METNNAKRVAGALAALLLASGAAQASRDGVEPAEMLSRGECELELALGRQQGSVLQGMTELGCRAGPVQLSAELEHAREPDGSQTESALEVKWARSVGDQWRLGLMGRTQWQAHQHPRHDATAIVGLATFTPREDVRLHLNLGRDFVHSGPDRNRSGIGAEWLFRPRWAALLERYALDETQFLRGSLRWDAGRSWSVEFGHSHRLRGPEPSRWAVVVSFELDDEDD